MDHEYRFWNINVGWPGRVHDACVFTNSELSEKAQVGTLLPSSPSSIHGVNVPLVILADPAYPLLPCVQHGNLSVAAKNFNCRLRRARMVVENALVVLRVAGVASWKEMMQLQKMSQPSSRYAVYSQHLWSAQREIWWDVDGRACIGCKCFGPDSKHIDQLKCREHKNCSL